MLVLFINFNTNADVDYDKFKYASFFEIISKPDVIDKQYIFLTGYIKEIDEVYFLCFSERICWTKGKEKIILTVKEHDIHKDHVTRIRKQLDNLNNCYAQVRGVFRQVEGSSYYLNFYGNLIIDQIPVHGSKETYLLCMKKKEEEKKSD